MLNDARSVRLVHFFRLDAGFYLGLNEDAGGRRLDAPSAAGGLDNEQRQLVAQQSERRDRNEKATVAWDMFLLCCDPLMGAVADF